MNKDTNEQYLKIYSNYKRMMVEVTSQIVAYEKGWTDEFSRSEIKKLYGKLIKEFTDIDFTQFTLQYPTTASIDSVSSTPGITDIK